MWCPQQHALFCSNAMRHRSVLKVINESVLHAKKSILHAKNSVLLDNTIISNGTMDIKTQVMEDNINITLYFLEVGCEMLGMGLKLDRIRAVSKGLEIRRGCWVGPPLLRLFLFTLVQTIEIV